MRRFILLALLALTACAMFAPYQPGVGVTPDLIRRWNCNPDYVALETRTAKEGLERGKNWIPQVGWTACKLMAWVGAPRDTDLQQSAIGRSASWWYRSETETHLVSLELMTDGPMRGQWVVDYVGW